MKNTADSDGILGIQFPVICSKTIRFRLLVIVLFLLLGLSGKLQAQDSTAYELMKISFKGEVNFSNASLKSIIRSQETPFWLWKFLNSFSSLGKAPSYYDTTLIDIDAKIIKEFYIANGSFTVVVTPEVHKDLKKHEAEIIYNISHASRSKFGSFAIEGIDSVKQNLQTDIREIFSIDSSQFYAQQSVKGSIDMSVSLLENNGHLSAKYDSSVIIKDTIKKIADVSVFMSPGKSYTISKVEIEKKGEGAAKVDEQLLRDIVGIHDGEIYNLEKIRQSQVRLFRTGLFTSIILGPKLADTSGNTVPLLLNGTIGPMNELAPELLMNNQQNTFNVGFGASYSRKNFLGMARKLTVTGNSGISNLFQANFKNLLNAFSVYDTSVFGYIEGTARIEQPYVFNRPILGILDGYYKLNKDVTSNKRSYGGKLSFEFELPTYTFINYLSAYYNFEVLNEVYLQKGNTISLDESLSILGADMKSFRANDPISPTHGYNLTFLFEEANLESYLFSKLFHKPYSGTLFYKLSATTAFYAPIIGNQNHIFAWKMKIGHLQAYSGDQRSIPSTRKFTAGGSNSLRGWKARELAPTQEITVLGEKVIVTGGTFLLEASLEYRYHLSKEIGVVFFNDFGNSWLGYKSLQGKDIAFNTGFGVRYFTPFAPVRVDFGFKIYDPNNLKPLFKKAFFLNVFEFQFGIGEAF
ncbi:MAG: BamA/TamA family outer membrane protein [Ignavibacteriales bacterium]|nr:BamA/TamA family outer membrane protein [Ignavibacteriales bacterium]